MTLPADALIAPVLEGRRVIAVVTVQEEAAGPGLARALAAADVPAEITLRTPQALGAIRAAVAEVPQAVVGAGTCLSPADLDRAREAGAAFAVTPGATPEMFRHALDIGLPLLSGVSTASEVMRGLDEGYRHFKFFPAIPSGGAEWLKAVAGPLSQARFCPTGGVTLENGPALLAVPTVVCVGGSWLTPADAQAQGDWARVERLAREARAVLG